MSHGELQYRQPPRTNYFPICDYALPDDGPVPGKVRWDHPVSKLQSTDTLEVKLKSFKMKSNKKNCLLCLLSSTQLLVAPLKWEKQINKSSRREWKWKVEKASDDLLGLVRMLEAWTCCLFASQMLHTQSETRKLHGMAEWIASHGLNRVGSHLFARLFCLDKSIHGDVLNFESNLCFAYCEGIFQHHQNQTCKQSD